MLKKFLVLIIFLGVLVFIFLPGYYKISVLNVRNEDLEQKNKRLKEENNLLKSEITRIEKDQVYQEKILREKMGVVRKNEIPVKLIPQETPQD